MFKEDPKTQSSLFEWKQKKQLEEKKIRNTLEKAYEQEKSKSMIMKRCSRIYHEFLKNVDSRLYSHLMSLQLSPDLQLMRWLRCVLTREFKLEFALTLWDFIFSGLESKHREDPRTQSEEFLSIQDDPLIHLEYLCVSMILQ
mmetsp:Transcript_26430/g.19813  ORF Transcript_26430/g.19813 Transcript_26430/m.19813 type:complete len:142 (-) Transcript_26430:660-1085(-)